MKQETKNQLFRHPVGDSICWDCKNAVQGECSGCSWSRDFKPVDGWNAVRRDISAASLGRRSTQADRESYVVVSCPKFIAG